MRICSNSAVEAGREPGFSIRNFRAMKLAKCGILTKPDASLRWRDTRIFQIYSRRINNLKHLIFNFKKQV